jgi:hypothetical protein
MADGSPGVLKPALISGLLFGFLGGAPFIGLLNCACCSLILGSGFVAAFLYSRDCRSSNVTFDAMSGVKVGLSTGIFYGLMETVTSTASNLLFHQATTSWMLEILEEVPEVSPEILEALSMGAERGLVPLILWEAVTNLAFGLVFATLGGLIAGAVFRYDPASPVPSSPGS